MASVKSAFGLDFGYTNDPSALFCGLVDEAAKTLWVFDEMYKHGMSNERIADEVTTMGYRKERIRAEAQNRKALTACMIWGFPISSRQGRGRTV